MSGLELELGLGVGVGVGSGLGLGFELGLGLGLAFGAYGDGEANAQYWCTGRLSSADLGARRVPSRQRATRPAAPFSTAGVDLSPTAMY